MKNISFLSWVLSVRFSDTQNNNLSLSVTKTNSWNRCKLTCTPALRGHTAAGPISRTVSIRHLDMKTTENRVQVEKHLFSFNNAVCIDFKFYIEYIHIWGKVYFNREIFKWPRFVFKMVELLCANKTNVTAVG